MLEQLNTFIFQGHFTFVDGEVVYQQFNDINITIYVHFDPMEPTDHLSPKTSLLI